MLCAHNHGYSKTPLPSSPAAAHVRQFPRSDSNCLNYQKKLARAVHSSVYSWSELEFGLFLIGESKLMAISTKSIWLLALSLFGFHAGAAVAATDGVLCGTDIHGESSLAAAPGCADVLAWSWGASVPVASGGGVVGTGQPIFQDISITKYTDTSSDDLLKALATQTPLAGIVEVREYGASCGNGCPIPLYMTVHMKDAYVTSISMGGSGGEDRFTENVSLHFGEVSYCYYPTTKGGQGAPQCFAYSTVKGVQMSPF